MNVSCIIMAGGKSSRMKLHSEKTIIPIMGKPMIEYIIKAALESNVSQVIVATSPYTLKTTNLIKNYGVKIVETVGKGYHEDLRQILEKFDLEIVLTISGDLPLIKKDDINQVIDFYKKEKKSSLVVMANVEKFEKFHIIPSYIMKYGDQKLVPIGINIFNGRMNKNEWQDEAIMIVDAPQFLFNVNTEADLDIIQKFLRDSNK